MDLRKLRVIEFTSWWAGPFVGTFLACFGADVTKIESVRHIDGCRMVGAVDPSSDLWWERSSFFYTINHNKRGITLDITSEAGREIFRRLVRDADVLIDNHPPQVLDKAGLGWEALRTLNPRLVMLRMPAFGLTGPLRDRVGYAQTVEQYSGVCWTTGYPDGPPHNPSGPADALGGAHGIVALLTALRRHAATGQSVLAESPLAEAALTMAGEQVLSWTGNGQLLTRDGNHDTRYAPHGVYRCAGTDAWVAIAVETDLQWQALAEITGIERWRADTSLDDVKTRLDQQERLDAEISAWTASREPADVTERLIAAGTPAAGICDPRFIHRQPQMAARGIFEAVTHPVGGTVELFVLPFLSSTTPRWSRSPAPTIGQHNRQVYLEQLGLREDELAALDSQGVTGTRPAGV